MTDRSWGLYGVPVSQQCRARFVFPERADDWRPPGVGVVR